MLDGADFTAIWDLGNPGPVTGNVTLLTVITPVGTENSREFYKTGRVPPSGGMVETVLTAQELRQAGIGPGNYLVSFVAFGAADRRIGQFFGNRLTIGAIGLDFDTQPTHTEKVPAGGDFEAAFDIGNTGNAADKVTLTVVFTPVGTENSVEVSKQVTVNPGGGRFIFGLSSADQAALNITPGMYVIRFLAFNGFGDQITDSFYSALVEFLFG